MFALKKQYSLFVFTCLFMFLSIFLYLAIPPAFSQDEASSIRFEQESTNEEEYFNKLVAAEKLFNQGIYIVSCQKFDRRYRDDYSLKEGLFKGYTVYGNYSINCDPKVLTSLQDLLDKNGIKKFKVVNLSRSLFSTPSEESIEKMKNFKTPTLSFPVGFPIYSIVGFYKDSDIDRYKTMELIPSLCYLNSEYRAKVVIPTQENILDFISYLDKSSNLKDLQKLCLEYKSNHSQSYRTVFNLY